MNCKECTENLSAFLDEELSAVARLEIEAHVSACPSCGRELASLEKSAAFVEEQMEELRPPPALWTSLEGRIRSLGAPTLRSFSSFTRSRWFEAGVAAAAALVLAVAAWPLLESRRADAELQAYMAQYVEARNSLEQVHRLERSPMSERQHPEFSENPFITDAEMPESGNPFTGDGQ